MLICNIDLKAGDMVRVKTIGKPTINAVVVSDRIFSAEYKIEGYWKHIKRIEKIDFNKVKESLVSNGFYLVATTDGEIAILSINMQAGKTYEKLSLRNNDFYLKETIYIFDGNNCLECNIQSKSKVDTILDSDAYNGVCPFCGGQAYLGLNSVECKNGCRK